MADFTLRVIGLSPLLTHNPASMTVPKVAGTKGSNIPTPENEAEAGLYRLDDGSFAIPGIGFRNGIIDAGGAWKSTRGRSSMKSVLGHIMVAEELVPLVDPRDGSPLRAYTIDARRAVVQRQGIIRHRPRFETWAATFTIVYDETLLPQPEILNDIANDAGRRMGVGDYRPARKGWFGRYAVVLAGFEFELADAAQ